MTFKQDASVNSVELANASEVDIGDDTIEKVVEVAAAEITSVKVMLSSDAVIIIDILSNRVQDLVRPFP